MKRNAIAIVAVLFAATLLAGPATQTLISAYNVSATSYVYDTSASNGADDAWVTLSGMPRPMVVVDVDTINATSLDVRIEGRVRVGGLSSGTAIDMVLLEKSYSATNVGDPIIIGEAIDELRVGVKVTGDSGTQSITISLHDGRSP